MTHILCVSGLHVGLILGGLLVLLKSLGVSRRQLPVWATPVLLVYAGVTGFGPAVIRASIMALMLLWAYRWGRESDWPTTLGLSAFVILLINPLQLYEVGFQLSFSATWGILYLGSFIRQKLDLVEYIPGGVKSVVQVTLSAQLGTLPVIIYYFNIVSCISLLANLVVMPFAGIILLMGFAASLGGLFLPFIAQLINAGTVILLAVMVWCTQTAGSVPTAYFYMQAWPWWGIVFYYGILVIIVEWSRFTNFLPAVIPEKIIKFKWIPILMACLIFFWGWVSPADRLEVHFIDVGQGDGILFCLPNGKKMLVDAGGWYNEFNGEAGAGEYVVVPYLKRMGINRLDVLIISHFHEDHAGGVSAVLDKIKVERLIIPVLDGEIIKEEAAGSILHTAEDKGVRVNGARDGDRLVLDKKVDFKFISPPRLLEDKNGYDKNEYSLVMSVDYKNISFLLTGDIEKDMQSRLVEERKLRSVDVLKVPHHGSQSFVPEFFDKTAPSAAVITVGEDNRFGLPHRDTLDKLEETGAEIYRTDRDGAVIINTDGYRMKVKTGR